MESSDINFIFESKIDSKLNGIYSYYTNFSILSEKEEIS